MERSATIGAHEALRQVKLLGIPWDEGSSYLRGSAAAPEAIRKALFSPASLGWSESGIDVLHRARLMDTGDVAIGQDHRNAWDCIHAAVMERIIDRAPLLCIGGDHAITFPVVQALHSIYGTLDIVQIDAQPGLYPDFNGVAWSHASPFARILEQGLANRLVQIGIRSSNEVQLAQARHYGVEMYPMSQVDRIWEHTLEFDRPVYISVDLDGLDPSFAPGVAHPEPGGMSTRELLRIIQSIQGFIVATDVVELNPSLDPNDQTAKVAAKVCKELLARLGESRSM